jgi:hypothetical protein
MPEKTFTIVLKRSPDYRIYPSTTVYGGPVMDRTGILMNVCVDHGAFPNYIAHPIAEDGVTVDLSTVQDQAQIGNIEREVLCGIYFTVEQAKRVVGWLNAHIAKIEGRTQ